MKTKTTEALQVTEPQKLPAKTQKMFDELMKIEKLQWADIVGLSEEERIQFYKLMTQMVQGKKGRELDLLVEKFEGIMHEENKQDIKDNNYRAITSAIANHVREHGRTPTKGEIAKVTGLSRKTVHKHLKEYAGSQNLDGKIEEYQLMAANVMDKVLRSAVSGDMKAARLYLETVSKLNKLTPSPASMFINQQNNYLQINGTILSQETLQQLPPEQLKLIEEIVKGGAVKQ